MRKPRIKPDAPEAFYHVMTRTSQCVFNLDMMRDPQIKEICHQIIHQMATIYHVNIHAWVFMDNHIHLCLSVEKPPMEEADIAHRFELLQNVNAHPLKWYPWLLDKFYRRFCDLSWFMWEVKTRIARAFNKRHKTSGYFWGGRFKSKVIEDEAALLRVMTYIEQNPVRAGLRERPSDFKWCSAGQMKRQIQQKVPTSAPQVGLFRGFKGLERAKAYVAWMDYQTSLILFPKKRLEPPPSKIATICLKSNQVEVWRKDFQKGAPSDWRSQGYGSKAFEKTIREAEKAKILALAHQRMAQSKTMEHISEQPPKEAFVCSHVWWHSKGDEIQKDGQGSHLSK